MLLRRRPKIHVAEDAAHAPHVLVFQVGAVAEAIHFHRQQIAPRFQMRSDVELGRRPAVLAIADLVPVDPRIERRIHAIEMQQDLPALPCGRHGEAHPVAAHRIELVRRSRRFRCILRERINNIGIDRDVEPVHLPARRHWHVAPPGVAVVRTIKIDRPLRRAQRPVELPASIQQLKPRRLGAIGRPRQLRSRDTSSWSRAASPCPRVRSPGCPTPAGPAPTPQRQAREKQLLFAYDYPQNNRMTRSLTLVLLAAPPWPPNRRMDSTAPSAPSLRMPGLFRHPAPRWETILSPDLY